MRTLDAGYMDGGGGTHIAREKPAAVISVCYCVRVRSRWRGGGKAKNDDKNRAQNALVTRAYKRVKR